MLTDTHRAHIAILIQELIGDPNLEITDDLHLTDDLGFDSLDAADLSIQLEEWVADLHQVEEVEPMIELEDWEKWETVGDIMQTMEGLL